MCNKTVCVISIVHKRNLNFCWILEIYLNCCWLLRTVHLENILFVHGIFWFQQWYFLNFVLEAQRSFLMPDHLYWNLGFAVSVFFGSCFICCSVCLSCEFQVWFLVQISISNRSRFIAVIPHHHTDVSYIPMSRRCHTAHTTIITMWHPQ